MGWLRGAGAEPLRVWRAVFDYSQTNRPWVLAAGAVLMIGIAVTDVKLEPDVALGSLYVVPLIVLSGFLKRWHVVGLAIVCAVLREAGSLMPWGPDYFARMTMGALAFAAAGLFVKELARNQQLAVEQARQVEARRQLEEELQHAQRLEAVGRVAGGVAHDFNNLLSVIIGYSDLAIAKLAEDTRVRADVEEVRKAAERAALLTRQLLVFSRRQKVEPKVLDLNVLVSNIHRMLERMIGEGVEFDLSLQPGLGLVKADAGQIEQVVMNLAVNSRDAMPAGGHLNIATANLEVEGPDPTLPPSIKPGSYVTLAVSDTGVGMDPAVQAHLFEPFFTTKETGKGTGLGLSMAYGIVKRNNGEIWFRSEPGQGTTFMIYLPRTEARAGTPGAPPPKSRSTGAAATILLVEDDEAVRKLTAEILKSAGHVVVEAGNAADALAIATQSGRRFDLLLTDLIMPHTSGRELAEQLAGRSPNLPVIFMTGYAGDSIPEIGGTHPGKAVLEKPFAADVLLQTIRAVLGKTNQSGNL